MRFLACTSSAFTLTLTPMPRPRLTLQLHDDGWREAAFESMESRQWSLLEPVIAAAVRGDAALPGDMPPTTPSKHPLAPPQSSGERVTWQLTVSYFGPAFSGFAWQQSAPKPTVEGCLQAALLPLLDGRSELRLSCAGRTDAGVSALAQLVSFHSWPQLQEREVAEAIRDAAPAPGALRLVRARRMEGSYHATYSTAWRRYAYLLPPTAAATHETAAAEAAALDALLRPLVAAGPRDYAALGRGVPAGKDTTMAFTHASARPVELSIGSEEAAAAFATRVDLVGDRFLRRQVRVLVATAVALATNASALQVGGALFFMSSSHMNLCRSMRSGRRAQNSVC